MLWLAFKSKQVIKLHIFLVMCMCYDGECHHKSKPLKALRKIISQEHIKSFEEMVTNGPSQTSIEEKKINHSYYFKRTGNYLLRKKDNKTMFYGAREDMPFVTLNLAQGLTLKNAKHLIKHFYPDCEAITSQALWKEFRANKIKFSF